MIPEGNYGAGAVIVWDRGEWVPLEDPKEGLPKGKLLFDLKGYKLRGRWTLVKIKKGEKEWLLIKETDSWLRKENGEDIPAGVGALGPHGGGPQGGPHSGDAHTGRAGEAEGAAQAVDSAKSSPMLTEPRDEAFTREGWIFELKLDGYRMIVEPRPPTGTG